MDAQQREDLRRRLDELDEIERQAAEMQADAEDSGVTEIHGGPQDQDDDILQ